MEKPGNGDKLKDLFTIVDNETLKGSLLRNVEKQYNADVMAGNLIAIGINPNPWIYDPIQNFWTQN